MAVDAYISDFVRDAQYRMAEIADLLNKMRNEDSPEYKQLLDWREQLYLFMDCLYVGNVDIEGGYNFLDWDDYSIQEEIEYLRNYTGMVTSPYTTFVGTYPGLVEAIGTSGGGAALPAGTGGQYIAYNTNGEPVAYTFPVKAGMNDNETALAYFS